MRRRPPRSTRTDTLFPYTTLFRSEVLHHDAAVDGDIDVIAGVVIDPYAILANFRGLLEAAVVHGVPDHLPCVESRHLGAARALQVFLREVDAVVDVVVLGRVARHGLHGVAALAL